MKQNISLFNFYTKIEPSNSRLKSRVCDGVIIHPDGVLLDTWDCSSKPVQYFWEK